MRTLAILILSLLTLLSAPALGADFDKGVSAFQRGDYATALREWTPLAEQGHVEAQYILGVMYSIGQGVEQDYATAAEWYRRAAEQGLADAQHNLGVMYALGQGVIQDYVKAHMWG
ncbi:MAG: tetratricopeptide repeat protein, partial [Alphaproteobacteria bacterium]